MKNQGVVRIFTQTQFSNFFGLALFIFVPIIFIWLGYEIAKPIYYVEPKQPPTQKPRTNEGISLQSIVQPVPIVGEYLPTHLDGLPVNEYRIAFSQNKDGGILTLFSSYHSEQIEVICHTPNSVYRTGVLHIVASEEGLEEFETRITSCADIVLSPEKSKLAIANEKSIVMVDLVMGRYRTYHGSLKENQNFGWLDEDLYFQPHIEWINENQIRAYVYDQSGAVGLKKSPLREELITFTD